MAKKVQGYIKLQIPAGKATPAPPVGPALGQHGVNIVEFTKQFNARTADQGDLIIASSQRHRRLPFLLRMPARSNPVQAHRIRKRLQKSQRLRFVRLQR